MTREERLLRRYADGDSQFAFAELVRRYYDFVYGVCRRKLGDRELAEDVTQAVFMLMASKARSFKTGAVIPAWLFRTADLACRNAMRGEIRRRHYEKKAAEELQHARSTRDETWDRVEPAIDDALARLSEADREAVLLRFVDQMTVHEVGAALGIGTDAAQKRISRAVDRLRRHLAHGGVAVSAVLLAVFMGEKLVTAAASGAREAVLGLLGEGAQPLMGGVRATEIYRSVLRHGRIVRMKAAAATVAALAVAGGAWFLVPIAAAHRLRTPPAAGASANVVTGRVVDSAGRPVSGAAVTLVWQAGSVAPDIEHSTTVPTGANGRYAVPTTGGPAGDAAVIADSGDRIGFGKPGTDTVLIPSTYIQILAVSPTGAPLRHIRLRPTTFVRTIDGVTLSISVPAGCLPRLTESTDDNGIAIFRGLPRSCMASFAGNDGDYVAPLDVSSFVSSANGAAETRKVLSFVKSVSIEGRATYASDGTPASGVYVEAQSWRTGAGWGNVVTDSRGHYRISGLPPGVYNVAVNENSPVLQGQWTARAFAGLDLVEAGSRATGCNFRLEHGVIVTGRVLTKDGAPVAGTHVGIYGPAHPQTSPWVESARTSSDGTYRLRVPSGSQYLYVMTMADSMSGKNIDVDEGHTRPVDLRASVQNVTQ